MARSASSMRFWQGRSSSSRMSMSFCSKLLWKHLVPYQAWFREGLFTPFYFQVSYWLYNQKVLEVGTREAQRLGLLRRLVRREIEKHFSDSGLEPEFVPHNTIRGLSSQDRPWCCRMASSSRRVPRSTYQWVFFFRCDILTHSIACSTNSQTWISFYKLITASSTTYVTWNAM
jgi:hypothetical protein